MPTNDTQLTAALAALVADVDAKPLTADAKHAKVEALWRAAAELRKGAQWRVDGDDVCFASRSRPGKWHWTRRHGCTCHAKGCWHRAGRAICLKVLAMAPAPSEQPAAGACLCGRALEPAVSVGGERVLECRACERAYMVPPMRAA